MRSNQTAKSLRIVAPLSVFIRKTYEDGMGDSKLINIVEHRRNQSISKWESLAVLRAEFLSSGRGGRGAMEGEAQQGGMFFKLAKTPCIFGLPIPV